MAFTANNDINILQASDIAVVGAGAGNDTYVLSPSTLSANQEIKISDAEGTNKLQLIGGLTIASSTVASNAVLLTLSNGAKVTVLGADTFSYEVGGNPLTGTAGTVQTYAQFATTTLGAASVPTTATGTAAGTANVTIAGGSTGTTAGQAFSLTTATEVKALTTGNDTVDGSVDNSINNDTIVDSTTTDSDVLNATLTASAAATISNIEQINLLDKFGTATLTATAISGGNVKVSSTFGTAATVTGVDGSKNLSVEAGENITTVTVNDVQKNATIKLTSAVTSLALDGTATAGGTDDTVTVNLAGNTALNISKGAAMVETITLKSATAANTVTLNTSLAASDLTKITATGDQSLTIKADDVDVNGVTFVDSTTAGTTTLELIKDGAGTTLDLTKVGFDKIKINETVHASDTFQVANNASIVLAKDTTADVELKIATGATTVNVDVAATQTAGIKANEFTTINLSSSATSAVNTKVIADATDTINVSGATDITINEDSVGIVKATGYTGKLTVNMATGEVINATGGNGNDTFIVSDAAIYTIDGGAGNNTLKIDGTTDIKGNSLTVSNIKVLNLDALLTLNNAQITGQSWIVQDTDGATTTKGLAVVMNDLVGQGLDLSGLVAGTATASVAVTGSVTANNIVGSVFGDSIEGGAGADTIKGGEGADSILGGDGADTINLTENTAAADEVQYAAATQYGDTVTGFAAGTGADVLSIKNTLFGDGDTTIEFGTAATISAGVISKGGVTAASASVGDGSLVSGAVNAGATNKVATADLANLTKVAALIGETVTVTAGGGGAATKILFVVEASDATTSAEAFGVYAWTQTTDDTDTSVGASELVLIGTFTGTGTVTSADLAAVA